MATVNAVIGRTISNSLYAYEPANEDTTYAINGRNEITALDGQTFTYDANRNLTHDELRAYTYDAANRMLSVANSPFTYDPVGNLHRAGAALLMSMVGGERLAIHRLDDGALNRRLVPGAGLDEYAGYYHGGGTGASARRWLLADHQGSIVAYTDASGEPVVINTYDEYGRAGPNNAERLQYTGQFTLSPGLDLIHYRNRFYNPRLGRFMQTDPIRYRDGLNMYACVGNDPVNRVDPWGLDWLEVEWLSCRAEWTDYQRSGDVTTVRGVTMNCTRNRTTIWIPGETSLRFPGGDNLTDGRRIIGPVVQEPSGVSSNGLSERRRTGKTVIWPRDSPDVRPPFTD